MNETLAIVDALMLIHEKAAVVVDCIPDYSEDAIRVQALACIANDYLTELKQEIRALHKPIHCAQH